jgi:hypothetical protein
MGGWMHPARKHPAVRFASSPLEPVSERAPCLFGNLELHRTAGLLLDHSGSSPQRSSRYDVGHSQCNDVAASQLAVQSNVKQRQVTDTALYLKPYADRPNVHRAQGQLGPDNARQRGWQVHGRLPC